jgi:succinoglycan biosynthesis protein ExoL
MIDGSALCKDCGEEVDLRSSSVHRPDDREDALDSDEAADAAALRPPSQAAPDSARLNAARRGRAILLAPDLTEVSTITRARAFLENGYDLTVFAFRRGRYNRGFQATWPQVELGQTTDGNYRARAWSMVRALGILWQHRHLLRGASILYARNLDQLALAMSVRLLLGRRARIAYEVLDIPAVLSERGFIGATLRWIERRLLGAVRVLVVSSAGFLRSFYEPVQGYRGPVFLLENKLHPSVLEVIGPLRQDRRPHRPKGKFKWVIGYFGLIRGAQTFDLICRVAEAFPDEILFHFSGIITTVDRAHFLETVDRHPNMIYTGEYVNPDDLPRLYGHVDFVWALDLENEHHNSRWLMPCRFYEAGLFAVPLLAARDFEVGDRVGSLDVGWTFAPPYDQSLIDFFKKLSRDEYEHTRGRLGSLPMSTFVSADEAATLCRLFDGD